jgi:plastocyanin
MAANSWSINIVEGNPCKFEPDVYVPPTDPPTPPPTVLTAETNDSISWNNQTNLEHRIYTESGGAEVHLTGLIPAYGSSDAFSPQNVETIDYYCCLHPDEKGTIEVKS